MAPLAGRIGTREDIKRLHTIPATLQVLAPPTGTILKGHLVDVVDIVQRRELLQYLVTDFAVYMNQ